MLICNVDEMAGEEHRLKTALELQILDGCADGLGVPDAGQHFRRFVDRHDWMAQCDQSMRQSARATTTPRTISRAPDRSRSQACRFMCSGSPGRRSTPTVYPRSTTPAPRLLPRTPLSLRQMLKQQARVHQVEVPRLEKPRWHHPRHEAFARAWDQGLYCRATHAGATLESELGANLTGRLHAFFPGCLEGAPACRGCTVRSH